MFLFMYRELSIHEFIDSEKNSMLAVKVIMFSNGEITFRVVPISCISGDVHTIFFVAQGTL